MARSTTSLRLADTLRARLAAVAEDEGTTVTALVERFAHEGLAMAAHPGVVYRPGPSGRRATLAGGPDIWEIASALRHTSGTESERVAALSEQFGLHERQIVVAINFAAQHHDEIAADVHMNDRALKEVERVSEARERLLA